HLPPSQGGRYTGFGNTPVEQKRDDFLDNTLSSLSSGWSTFALSATKFASVATEKATQLASTTAKKTKELSSTVSESVIKPTADKVNSVSVFQTVCVLNSLSLFQVRDGNLLNEVGTSMSGFASKLTAAGTKGWKDLQSLWGEPKTTLTSADTSPGEKSSLLGKTAYTSGEEASKNQLLEDEDESWGQWGQGGDWSSSKASSKANNSDWSAGNDDDLEAWLNDDTSSLSRPSKSKTKPKNDDDWDSWKTTESSKSSSSSRGKKKSSNKTSGISSSEGWDDADWSGGFVSTSTSKPTEPLVENLLGLDSGTSVAKSAAGDGWDNEVWAADGEDTDDWQTLELTGNSKQTR
ncbi:unnamed protein product, partial [Candidula unifasciata]